MSAYYPPGQVLPFTPPQRRPSMYSQQQPFGLPPSGGYVYSSPHPSAYPFYAGTPISYHHPGQPLYSPPGPSEGWAATNGQWPRSPTGWSGAPSGIGNWPMQGMDPSSVPLGYPMTPTFHYAHHSPHGGQYPYGPNFPYPPNSPYSLPNSPYQANSSFGGNPNDGSEGQMDARSMNGSAQERPGGSSDVIVVRCPVLDTGTHERVVFPRRRLQDHSWQSALATFRRNFRSLQNKDPQKISVQGRFEGTRDQWTNISIHDFSELMETAMELRIQIYRSSQRMWIS